MPPPSPSPPPGPARPTGAAADGGWRPTRRGLLVGGGAGVGLLVAWTLWPRRDVASPGDRPGETVFDARLRIAADGRVIVAVPQVELGQGIWTALAQALADELGADWRQVAVEPAPPGPAGVNRLLAEAWGGDRLPRPLAALGPALADRWADDRELTITAGSTSVRMFEEGFRRAGAAARALLCVAAARRLGVDWRACDTAEGFVVRGLDRFRFGELSGEAAGLAPPDRVPLRRPGQGRISGEAVPRIDLPAKVDGSLAYAGDVRLPGMAYAAIRHGPLGRTRLAGADVAAAMKVAGARGVVRREAWIATVADTGWAAERMMAAAHARFATAGALPDTTAVDRALAAALAQAPAPQVAAGTVPPPGAGWIAADYSVPLAAHAAIEPLVATARPEGRGVALWIATQCPSLARAAVARATGLGEGDVAVYALPVGGGFGRKLEADAAVEAATIALELKRPVQLAWGRAEEMQRARHRPPARARLAARLDAGRITAWTATVATPPATSLLVDRLTGGGRGLVPDPTMLDGLQPPYAVPAVALTHAPAALPIEVGAWRSGAREANLFFAESFADELAGRAGVDPLAFRMAQLGAAPRLARCLARAASGGGWTGEAGAPQGLAVHSAYGSHIAVLAEAAAGDGRPRVTRLHAVIDCGRMIHPDIVRQLVEGGLVWGLAASVASGIGYVGGVVEQRTLGDLHLPRLADLPEITVELTPSTEAPGGVAELAVPVAAPAIANALASATGRRLRALPLAW